MNIRSHPKRGSKYKGCYGEVAKRTEKKEKEKETSTQIQHVQVVFEKIETVMKLRGNNLADVKASIQK